MSVSQCHVKCVTQVTACLSVSTCHVKCVYSDTSSHLALIFGSCLFKMSECCVRVDSDIMFALNVDDQVLP